METIGSQKQKVAKPREIVAIPRKGKSSMKLASEISASDKLEQVYFDKSIQRIDPNSVHQVKLSSGRIMPVAAFGTFHSDWAQDYMEREYEPRRCCSCTG